MRWNWTGLLAGWPPSQFVESFCSSLCAVRRSNQTKTMYTTSSKHFLYDLQFMILIILECMVILLYFVILSLQTVHSMVMSSNIGTMHFLPNL